MLRFFPDVEALGFIPTFLSEDDPRPARDQFNENYAHGGGWSPMRGWKFHPQTQMILYHGEVYRPISRAHLRDETIIVYQDAWVCILQKDGSFEVSRMD